MSSRGVWSASRPIACRTERTPGCQNWRMTYADYVSPEWQHSALLIVDVQNDFVSGSSVVDGTAERLAALTRLAAMFRAAHRPIVHVVRL